LGYSWFSFDVIVLISYTRFGFDVIALSFTHDLV
jgi:hypothetical protein